jgi:hypothetical protein
MLIIFIKWRLSGHALVSNILNIRPALTVANRVPYLPISVYIKQAFISSNIFLHNDNNLHCGQCWSALQATLFPRATGWTGVIFYNVLNRSEKKRYHTNYKHHGDISGSYAEYINYWLLGCCAVFPGRNWIIALVMEAVITCETSVKF